MIGSPLFSKHCGQVGHQLPGRRILVEMEVTPEIARRHTIPIVFASSRETYRRALANVAGLVAQSDAYYRSFEARTLRVRTPDATLNEFKPFPSRRRASGW
jgi:hypothetical protein